MDKKVKALLEEKAFRWYLIINLLVFGILIAEFIFFEYGPLKIVRYLILVEALFIIAWIDQKEHIIHNKHLLILVGIRIAILICEWVMYPMYGLSILTSSLTGLAIGFLIFGLCYLVARGGMGAGDVKLVAVLGFYLGSTALMPVLILSVFASAIYSIFKLIRKKTNLKAEIPFAPFVLIGTVVGIMLGV